MSEQNDLLICLRDTADNLRADGMPIAADELQEVASEVAALIDWQQKALPLMQAAATWMPSKKCAAHIREIETLVARVKGGAA
ncbi:hypothetical protein GIW57_13430 [Stenotrophomonas sp. PA-6-5C]|uniref:hypothetical protein n=1 Tax=Stenotrophomonas sp. PA-6-5C TaxID=2665487 RepID=UPI001F402694|nr:hypothetical protein [Stenotrophomonas sp. PA-6-5C]MCF5091167.1 hypothetical protein [Stenotrophomonas sp. PA-6-5C]